MEAALSQLDLHSGAPFATLVRDLAAVKNRGGRILRKDFYYATTS